MKQIKVLVGTPICDKKMYCWREYVKAVKAIRVPDKNTIGHVLIVDTSDEIDAVKFEAHDENFMYQQIQMLKSMDKVVAARNTIFDYANKNNYDYVLFIDSDVIAPENTMKRLMSHKKEVVGGFYPILTEHGLPIPCAKLSVMDDGDVAPRFIDFPANLLNDQVHPVDIIGLGCCLIHKNIFSKFKFRCERGKYGDLLRSEDWCFCEDLQKSGVAINFDTGLSAKHKIVGQHWDPKEA